MSQSLEARNKRIIKMLQDPDVDMTRGELAAMFGVSTATLNDIWYRYKRRRKEAGHARSDREDHKATELGARAHR